MYDDVLRLANSIYEKKVSSELILRKLKKRLIIMANSNVYYLAYDGFPTSNGGAFSSVKMYIYNVDEIESWHNIIDITGSATPNAL